MNYELYFAIARERHNIYLKKQSGEPKPWTSDPIFQKYRFCNVSRELDKVTVWFRDNYRSGPGVTAFGCVAFRFFNRIETGELLVSNGLLRDWNVARARKALKHLHPLVGGAYIINTSGSPGKSKLEGIIDILQPVWKAQQSGKLDFRGMTLQAATERLTQFPYVGNFMAYQAVADIRHTPILKGAPDTMDWACVGPGAARGLARLLGEPVKRFHYSNPKGQAEMLPYLRKLLSLSLSSNLWPVDYPEFDMQGIQNWLCEFSKYTKVRDTGVRLKQRYPGL